MRLAMVLAKLCATESPTIFATGRKDSGNRLIGIPYRLAMIGQWARLYRAMVVFKMAQHTAALAPAASLSPLMVLGSNRGKARAVRALPWMGLSCPRGLT